MAESRQTLPAPSYGQAFVVTADPRLVDAVTPPLESVGFAVECIGDADVRRVLYGQVLVLDLRAEESMHRQTRALVELLATFRVRPCAVAIIDHRDALAFAVNHGLGIVGVDVLDAEIAGGAERAVRDLRRPRVL